MPVRSCHSSNHWVFIVHLVKDLVVSPLNGAAALFFLLRACPFTGCRSCVFATKSYGIPLRMLPTYCQVTLESQNSERREVYDEDIEGLVLYSESEPSDGLCRSQSAASSFHGRALNFTVLHLPDREISSRPCSCPCWSGIVFSCILCQKNNNAGLFDVK